MSTREYFPGCISLLGIICLMMGACVDTQGTLELKGKITDETTGTGIPGKLIIIEGLSKTDGKISKVYAGQFPTDSSGNFIYTMVKIKDVFYYNFSFTGDSDYAFKTTETGLYELKLNSQYLHFTLNKLTDLTIKIYRQSKKPEYDTLALYWQSDGISAWSLYPYRIENYEKKNTSILARSSELRWIGGKVNSVVKTRVLAGKMTKLRWDLDRNGKRYEIRDTITCQRDRANTVYFTY